jgi:hypothetical protein
MISVQTEKDCVSQLTALKYFPAQAASAVGEMFRETCQTDDEAYRLTKLALLRFSDWPSLKALKDLYAGSVAARRPREEQVYCPMCSTGGSVAGHRSGFHVWEKGSYPAGPPEEVFPETDKLLCKLRGELQERYKGTGVTVTSFSTYCVCQSGQALKLSQRRTQ